MRAIGSSEHLAYACYILRAKFPTLFTLGATFLPLQSIAEAIAIIHLSRIITTHYISVKGFPTRNGFRQRGNTTFQNIVACECEGETEELRIYVSVYC